MSFATALALSRNNLLTKKARTLLTALAGSIGIIGIGLILALSSGMQAYIARAEKEMLISYPVTLETEAVALGTHPPMSRRGQQAEPEQPPPLIRVDTRVSERAARQAARVRTNDLAAFKQYLETHAEDTANFVIDVAYGYDSRFIVHAPTDRGWQQVHPGESATTSRLPSLPGLPGFGAARSGSSFDAWQELTGNDEILAVQYDIVAGRWPNEWNELVLIVDDKHQISEFALPGLGLGTPEEAPTTGFDYDYVLGLQYKLTGAAQYYDVDPATGVWEYRGLNAGFVQAVAEQAPDLRIVGIVQPTPKNNGPLPGGTVAYRPAFTERIIAAAWDAPIVQQQLAQPETNVLTGRPFGTVSEPTDMTPQLQNLLRSLAGGLGDMPLDMAALAEHMPADALTVPDTYDDVLASLGAADRDRPASIKLYTKDFAGREQLATFIADYNEAQQEAGRDGQTITYTDFIQLVLSSVTTIINSISYVLIAFVAISLVVSSIMIGIITYISVIERTKEIGILRSLGAAKRDISRVFNAETLLVGFTAGTLGVMITLLLTLPINAIIKRVADIDGLAALPLAAAFILIASSMILTVVAGFIPARMAARQNPVEALRTE